MQNPSLLNQILTAIQRTNPQLYIKIVQEMNQNPQESEKYTNYIKI